MSVWIGAVQQQYLAVVLGAGVHQPAHCYIIGIEPQAYILDVNNQYIKFSHGCFARFLVFPVVKRKDGDTRFLVDRTGYVFSCIRISAKAVFG